MEGIGKAWEGGGEGLDGDTSVTGVVTAWGEGAHMPIRPYDTLERTFRYADMVLQHLVGPVRGSWASDMFGVAAESGGNQRMGWVFMARRGRQGGPSWAVENPLGPEKEEGVGTNRARAGRGKYEDTGVYCG
ncbi:hypothetical protein V502_07233 [Pseudogymnoascus sp. VKM F-4520 (FW-2644)]|nr:hypothetical protein V502_07233 [Pseudogymnoascus sp. VKM F-4520 (FW-2644)]